MSKVVFVLKCECVCVCFFSLILSFVLILSSRILCEQFQFCTWEPNAIAHHSFKAWTPRNKTDWALLLVPILILRKVSLTKKNHDVYERQKCWEIYETKIYCIERLHWRSPHFVCVCVCVRLKRNWMLQNIRFVCCCCLYLLSFRIEGIFIACKCSFILTYELNVVASLFTLTRLELFSETHHMQSFHLHFSHYFALALCRCQQHECRYFFHNKMVF